jgi:L-seryl-tRNA(Ser) seleniumtransferase
MTISSRQQDLLRQLPGVDTLHSDLIQHPECRNVPKSVVLRAIREILEQRRDDILKASDGVQPSDISIDTLKRQTLERIGELQAFNLRPLVNATGVVVHTNLGRSCLAPEAIRHMNVVAAGYSNLEFDLTAGRRGSRYSAIEEILCEISGAEAAMVVNNNAGAVLLCLDALARDREVIISRGELVEIGGAFRIPDVMTKSGARLREVGTTNRTHLRDYEAAIGADTGMLLKVHTSNYHISGFTAAVALEELVSLGNRFNLTVMEDLGSGNFIDLAQHGLTPEPTVQESVAAGAHVVTFSGDKLLGGPQAGLIVGRKAIIDQIKTNPLTRALRIDKMTLAALEATLHLYRDPELAIRKIPTLRMLLMQKAEIENRARHLKKLLEDLNLTNLRIDLLDLPSKAGGGSLPLLELPSCCVGLQFADMSPNTLEKRLRRNRPPIIGRIENDWFLIDPRTVQDNELDFIPAAVNRISKS